MNTQVASQDAVVLSGSGANAAYEVGILKAILRERWGVERKNPPIDPFCYAGTSIGALNAAIMASQSDTSTHAAIEQLEKLWLETITGDRAVSANGLYRVRTDPTQLLNPATYLKNPIKPFLDIGADSLHFARRFLQRIAFAIASSGNPLDGVIQITEFSEWLDVAPLVDLVHKYVELGKIALSKKKLRITAVNWDKGVPKTFANRDMESGDGHEVILAALAIPAVLPARVVEGNLFIDAAVLMNSPLAPAIEARDRDTDADLRLHVIYLDANKTAIPLPSIPNTFSTVYRLYMLALSRSINADISRAANTNERIRVRKALELVAAAPGVSPQEAIKSKLGPIAASLWSDVNEDTKDKVPLTVHRYHPSKNLYGFEVQQFQRKRVEQLIQDGYQDALNHDCEKSGCVGPKS